MEINKKLKYYIENNIFPSYENNDLGHNLEYLYYVMNRSLRFASQIDDINYDMAYPVTAYHDIGHYIDAKNDKKIAIDILLPIKNSENLFMKRK